MKKATTVVAPIIVAVVLVGIWFAARQRPGRPTTSPAVTSPPVRAARPGGVPPTPESSRGTVDSRLPGNQERPVDVLRRARALANRPDVAALTALRDETLRRAEQQGIQNSDDMRRLLRELDRYLAEARRLQLTRDGSALPRSEPQKPTASEAAPQPPPRLAPEPNPPVVLAEPEREVTNETPVPPVRAPAVPPPEAPRNLETPSPPAMSPEVARARAAASQQDLASVQQVLGRYEQMYDQLDASMASSIWPQADSRALARVFARLERQELHFDGCAVAVSESRATALCTGRLEYVPRVGSGTPRQEKHSWTIEFERSGGEWRILQVGAR